VPPRQVHVVGVALIRDGRCLVAQRSEGTSFALCWEFPGGKVEPGEAPGAALERELKEELGVQVLVGEWLGRGETDWGDMHIALDVFVGKLTSGEPTALEHRELRWCSADELSSLRWADADVPVVPLIQRRLSEERRLVDDSSPLGDVDSRFSFIVTAALKAADLLNVSRQYLVRLLDQGRIPFTKTGKHRRLKIEDMLAFKEERDRERKAGLDELARMSEEFGGNDELK